jgi:hypothetical protein
MRNSFRKAETLAPHDVRLIFKLARSPRGPEAGQPQIDPGSFEQAHAVRQHQEEEDEGRSRLTDRAGFALVHKE